MATYNPADPGWSNSGAYTQIYNAGGLVGAWLADVLLYLLGYLAYLFPVMIGYSGWLVYRDHTPSGGIDLHVLAVRWSGLWISISSRPTRTLRSRMVMPRDWRNRAATDSPAIPTDRRSVGIERSSHPGVTSFRTPKEYPSLQC